MCLSGGVSVFQYIFFAQKVKRFHPFLLSIFDWIFLEQARGEITNSWTRISQIRRTKSTDFRRDTCDCARALPWVWGHVFATHKYWGGTLFLWTNVAYFISPQLVIFLLTENSDRVGLVFLWVKLQYFAQLVMENWELGGLSLGVFDGACSILADWLHVQREVISPTTINVYYKFWLCYFWHLNRVKGGNWCQASKVCYLRESRVYRLIKCLRSAALKRYWVFHNWVWPYHPN